MIYNHIVIDNFFERPHAVRSWAMESEFQDEVSPWDGLVYHDIVTPVHPVFLNETLVKLSYVFGSPIEHKISFLRMLKEGTKLHNWIHTDATIGTYILLVYLNTPEQCRGGTLLFAHDTLKASPKTKEEHDLWYSHSDSEEHWRLVGKAEMAFNRACIISTEQFHASEPKGGFGSTKEDGRLVFTMFFTPVGGL